MDIIKLIPTKLNVEEVLRTVSSPTSTATSIFIETAGEENQGRKIVWLKFEAYEPTALAEIQKLCLQIRAKWNVGHIGIYQRLGKVPIKEPSLIIAVSSEHETDSLEALRFAKETFSKSVPIHKRDEEAEDEEGMENQNQQCIWNQKKNQVLFRRNVDEGQQY